MYIVWGRMPKRFEKGKSKQDKSSGKVNYGVIFESDTDLGEERNYADFESPGPVPLLPPTPLAMRLSAGLLRMLWVVCCALHGT